MGAPKNTSNLKKAPILVAPTLAAAFCLSKSMAAARLLMLHRSDNINAEGSPSQ